MSLYSRATACIAPAASEIETNISGTVKSSGWPAASVAAAWNENRSRRRRHHLDPERPLGARDQARSGGGIESDGGIGRDGDVGIGELGRDQRGELDALERHMASSVVESANRLAHDDEKVLDQIGADRAVWSVSELALGDLDQRRLVPERPQLALVHDAHVVVAALARPMDPLGEVELLLLAQQHRRWRATGAWALPAATRLKSWPRLGGGSRMGVVRNGGVQLPRDLSHPPSDESKTSSAAKGCGTNGPVKKIGICTPSNVMMISVSTCQPWKAEVSTTIW